MRRPWLPLILVALAAAWLVARPVWAQRSERRGGGLSGGREAILRRLDGNGDGVLDDKEIPARVRPLINRAARRVGVEEGQPLEISKLTGGQSPATENTASENQEQQPPDQPEAERADSQDPNDRDDGPDQGFGTPKAGEETPRVRGFGESVELPAVPGFGVRVDPSLRPRLVAGSGAEDARRSRSESARAGGSPSVRDYSLSLIKKYDKNGNNMLDEEELAELKGEPAKADRNGDGTITLEELVAQLGTYEGKSSSKSSSQRESRRRRSDRESREGGDETQERPSYRFRAAGERLPKDLPGWFSSRDKNADGQVTMDEYSRRWSAATVAEFEKLDRNGDGMITPDEAKGR